MEETAIIGASIPRVDALARVTGKAVYGTDIALQGMLHGKVLRSPLPHARILHVDTSRAERVAGVRTVVTGKDLIGPYGALVRDQPCYCFDRVRYVGDPVAGIAATSLDAAEEALELIRVDYEELPPVFDPLVAMEPDAPRIHEDLGEYWHGPVFFPVAGTNICNHFKLRKGNIEEGFRQSDVIYEDTYTTQMVQHCHLEPHVSVARVDPSGEITIWSNTQHPYTVRRELARLLNVPINRIRVIVTCLGGGFGGKVMLKVEPLCVVLAIKDKNHRPIKIELTREEEFLGTATVRHPSVIKIKAGIKKDGMLMAWQSDAVFDTGAYADVGPVVARTVGVGIAGPYEVANMWGDTYCVYTNKMVAGAFRGLGMPQVTWAIESVMDKLAESIGMDAVEFRLKNALEEGSVSATGQILQNVGIKACIRKAAKGIGWGQRPGKNRGKGVAATHKMTQTPSTSAAFVKLNEDGTVEVLSSTVEMGQGSNTILAQIAAEELGVKVKDVKIVSPDTAVTPYDHGTASSRSTFHMGNAVKQAAADAKKQLLELAADQLEANVMDLEAVDGFIFVKGSPEKRSPISEIDMGITYGRGTPVLGKGTFDVPDATVLDQETGQGTNPVVYWMYATQAAEVEVDTGTGKVEVLKLVSAHDLGRAINPLNCAQQIEGAIVQGVGFSLMEEMVLEGGKVLNPNLRDYKLPTAMDDIPEVTSMLVEEHHDRGPHGAKGVGEPAMAPTAAAIGNATPEKILKALKEKEEAD
jgi:carbon-monoxide dehydrogenase large subunit